jgi:hypothetical protein
LGPSEKSSVCTTLPKASFVRRHAVSSSAIAPWRTTARLSRTATGALTQIRSASATAASTA